MANLDTPVTAAEFQHLTGVSRHVVGMWRKRGLITAIAHRGRSPLYRYRDLLHTERNTRQTVATHGGKARRLAA